MCCNGVISEERFCKRNGEKYGDVFMSSKMMKFQREREREREIDSGCVSVWLGPLYIEPSM